MRCGALDAESCVLDHWCPLLGGHREPSGWRAACPVCHAERGLEYDVPGRSVRWQVWCTCEKQTVRKALTDLLPQCMPAGRRDKTVSPAEAEALALSRLPITPVRVALLMMAGRTVTEAMDELGVDRTTRYRIRDQLSQFRDRRTGHR